MGLDYAVAAESVGSLKIASFVFPFSRLKLFTVKGVITVVRQESVTVIEKATFAEKVVPPYTAA